MAKFELIADGLSQLNPVPLEIAAWIIVTLGAIWFIGDVTQGAANTRDEKLNRAAGVFFGIVGWGVFAWLLITAHNLPR